MIYLRKILQILRIGGARKTIHVLIKELMRRIYSNESHRGFVYDLSKGQDLDGADGPTPVRTLKPSDVKKLYGTHDLHIQTHDLRAILQHLLFLEADIQTPYVWVDADDNPSAICWLITEQSNQNLGHHFGEGLPILGEDDILLEFIYTRPDSRGHQLMFHLTRELFRIGRQLGKRRAHAYINTANNSSLAGCERIGWKPHISKLISWRWFRRRIQYKRFDVQAAQLQSPP